MREDGSILIQSGVYTDIEPIGEDLFALRSGDRYAIADGSGTVLTPAEYTEIKVHGDMVCVGMNGLYGLIDRSGNSIADPIFSELTIGDAGAWALRPHEEQLYLLSSGRPEYAPLSAVDTIGERSGDGLLAIRMSETMKWGYCNQSGRQIVKDRYDYAETFSAGLARVTENGGFGVIDTQGAEIVPCAYERLEIRGDLIAAQTRGTVVIFSGDGREKARYENGVYGFSIFDGRYAIYSAEGVDLYSENGTMIASCAADTQLAAGIDGDIIISEGTWGQGNVYLWGFEDKRWLDLTPLGYATEQPVYRGAVAEVITSTDGQLGETIYSIDPGTLRYAIVSNTGEALNDELYKSIHYLGPDRFLTETADQWKIIDTKGNIYFATGKEGEKNNERSIT